MITVILKSVISLFLIMLVGVYGSKKNIITTEINKGLIDILLKIALPFMIIASFVFTYDNTIKANVFKTFYYSIICYVIVAIISYILVFPIKEDKRTILHFANVFTNTGYIGFPILYAMYGSEAVIYGSIFNMFFVIFLWTYGIILFRGHIDKKELKREIIVAITNPSVIAVLIGLLIMIFDIRIPDLLLTSIKSVGNITGPLSMIIVGAILAKVEFKNYLKDWTIYYGIVTKLIIIPVLLYLISVLIKDTSIVADSVIVLASMPAAAMTSILAESYNKEKDYATIIVLMTTLFSIITIPFLIKILM